MVKSYGLSFFMAVLILSFSEIVGQDLKNAKINEKPQSYVLLFSPSYDGQIKWKFDEYEQMVRSQRDGLINEFNKFGEKNYRIHTATDNLAIFRLDEGGYEYDWLETTSTVHFAKSGLAGKLEQRLSRGYRIIEHFPFSQSCEPLFVDFQVSGEKCEYRDLFFVERRVGEKKSVQQLMVSSVPGWGGRPSEDMTTAIEERLAEGFYPVRAISKFEILLEKTNDRDDFEADKPDVRVVRSAWGRDDIEKKVNDLAAQGYRLAFAMEGIAVLYRNKETAGVPVSYVWLNAKKKNFEKELSKLQAKGARYWCVYPSEKGSRNMLIFEQSSDSKGERSEFRILKFKLDARENTTERRVYLVLTPEAKRAVDLMNKLAKEGFVVHDLFESDGAGVILERVR